MAHQVGDKVKVYGMGKEFIGGVSEFIRGEEVEAELVRPLRENSPFWWVKFEGDVDDKDRQILRIRQVVR